MKKLDVYILTKFLKTFVFVVFALVAIICVIDYTEKYDDFIKNQVPGEEVQRYYMTFVPYIISLLTPITVFIATTFVTAKLAANTEMIAILASGISFRRIMLPYLIGASLIAVVSFYLNSYVIPDANKFRINFENENVNKAFYFSDRNFHIKIGSTDYLYMDRYNNHRDVAYKVTLEKIDSGRLKEKLHAARMVWDTATSKWSLKDWERRVILDTNEIYTRGSVMDTSLLLSPSDFDNKDKIWETMTLTELNTHIDLQMSRGAEDVQIYRIERYIRFMTPFTVIILMFIGVIVSAKKNRRGTGFQIALGFLIAFIFIIFFILARAIAEAGTLNPILAVWIPNIIFSMVGVLMYFTIPR